MTFDEFEISDALKEAVREAGYSEPTEVQKQAIPPALAGKDVLGIAQTGTGKTAGFTLPMIDILSKGRARARMPRSLILAPTRELADQVRDSFEKYGKHNKLKSALLIGGVSFGEQEKALSQGVDVLIATPGRLLDHFERGNILLTGVEILVIDEADRMLDMGFIPDIEKICGLCPPRRQTLFFSATMAPEIAQLAGKFLRDPVRVEVARQATTAETVTQFAYPISRNDPKSKRDALRKVIEECEVTNGMIFCNRKRDVDILTRSLKKYGFKAAAIHGDLDQRTRMQVLEEFRGGDLGYLVASDVAARGLDIPDVSHVFNYDVPYHAEDYVHRIGRTGRAGRSGEAHMIVCPEQEKSYAAIIELIGKKPEEKRIDHAKETKAKSETAREKSKPTEIKKAVTKAEEKDKAAKKPKMHSKKNVDIVDVDAEFIARKLSKIQSALRDHYGRRYRRPKTDQRLKQLLDRHREDDFGMEDSSETKPTNAPKGFGEDVPAFFGG